jgi:hypothetical protein
MDRVGWLLDLGWGYWGRKSEGVELKTRPGQGQLERSLQRRAASPMKGWTGAQKEG